MAIADGMRTHDEGQIHRYRMPDLLTKEEMQLYFAGTYGIGIEFTELSDDMREKVNGVGVLPYSYPPTEREREFAILREQLGIVAVEDQQGITHEGRIKELDSKVMTSEQFAEKYGEQPAVAPPKETETDESGEPVEQEQQDVELPPDVPKQESRNPQEELDILLKDDENKE